MAPRKLTQDECRIRIDPTSLTFDTTAAVEPARGVVSQERALQALELGLEIRQPRFHIVVVGSPGSGRTFSVRSTAERIGLPDDLVGRIEGKSSLGRLGLLIHTTAGFVDAGFDGGITLELSNVASLPITLYPGMKIGQISFLQMTTPADVPDRKSVV